MAKKVYPCLCVWRSVLDQSVCRRRRQAGSISRASLLTIHFEKYVAEVDDVAKYRRKKLVKSLAAVLYFIFNKTENLGYLQLSLRFKKKRKEKVSIMFSSVYNFVRSEPFQLLCKKRGRESVGVISVCHRVCSWWFNLCWAFFFSCFFFLYQIIPYITIWVFA